MNKEYANKKIESAFEEYGKAIEKYCKIRLGEAVDFTDDCVQEAFLVYYKKLLLGEQFENPRAFLYKTANIMVLRAKEKYIKNAMHNKSLDDAEDIAVEMEINAYVDIDYDKIKEILISKLNDNEKELYQMKYVEEKSLKEIGLVLNIPPSAVANRTSRLRTKIKKLIEPVLKDFTKGGS